LKGRKEGPVPLKANAISHSCLCALVEQVLLNRRKKKKLREKLVTKRLGERQIERNIKSLKGMKKGNKRPTERKM
jgi:hypothetical protein